MKLAAFEKIFPTPGFLAMPGTGIDISDHSIKIVDLKKGEGALVLSRHAEKKIPHGIIEGGKIKDEKKLRETLTMLAKEFSLGFVRVSLPEEQVYSFNMHLTKVPPGEIRSAIELQLEEHIPIAARDAIFDYDLIAEHKDSYDLQVSAASRAVVESYFSIFRASGLSPVSFELEADSIARVIIPRGDRGTYMVVDFGESRTGIFIVSDGVVRFTSTFDIGGFTLTKMIEKSFNVDFAQAEEMKTKNGLRRSPENRELFAVLLNSVSVLRDEINKQFVYWHTHKDEDGQDRKKIEKIILCGGNSNLFGLSDYLSMSIKTRVEFANVWVNVNSFERYLPDILAREASGYATALGLALGNFEYD